MNRNELITDKEWYKQYKEEFESHNSGAWLILMERIRQIEVEGWDNPHDENHKHCEMVGAAVCYAVNALNKAGYKVRAQIHLPAENGFLSGNTGDRGGRQLRKAGWYDAWPWDSQWDKRAKHDYRRSLVIAGALIAAELDRLNSEPNDKRSVATEVQSGK